MRGNRWGASVLVAVALAVGAGCGDDAAGPRDAATTTPRPSAPATSEGNGPMVPELPDLTRTPKPTLLPSKRPAERTFGADISWPQCPKGMGIPQKRSEGQPMPTDAARFVIIGLTNGPSFVANPCIESQVQWIRDRGLLGAAYSVVSYPDQRTLEEYGDRGPFPGSTRLGALRNVGYQAAVFNMGTMKRAGLQSPVVWIDVEPVRFFDWSPDLEANAAVVQGMARGYRDGGYRIGFYSTPSLWSRVVGDLRFGAPEWRAAGQTSMAEALSRCGPDWSIQGGPGVLGQWVEDNRDRNVTCPGAMPDLREWFHQY